MRTSMIRFLPALLLALLATLLIGASAAADDSAPLPPAEEFSLARHGVVVLPLLHEVPRAGTGLAALLASELAASGRYEVLPPAIAAETLDDKAAWKRLCLGSPGCGLDAAGLNGYGEFVLAGSVLALDIYDKDVKLDLGADFRDLGAMVNGQNRIAQVKLELHLLRCSDGAEFWSGEVEGLESQRGVRRHHSTIGWLSGLEYGSDEFRQTQLGRAAYKAIGQALREIYAALPLEARVLAVTPGAVVLNLNEHAGLILGEELQVFARDELQNSQGLTVWSSERRVGAVQITQFQPGRALCLILDGQDSILEGDIARPLNEPLLLPLETDK